MLKSTIYTLIISILLATAAIFGYLYFVVYVGGMGGDLFSMYKKSAELTKEEDSLNSIKRVAQNADQRNIEISKYIVPVENEGSIKFVKTVEETADSFGLKYSTNAIEIVSDDNLSKINKEYLSVKISISGSESSVSGFVKKLESLPFNVKIRSYSLSNIGKIVSASSTSGGMDNSQQLDYEILVVKEK
jgi:hypothetical protein